MYEHHSKRLLPLRQFLVRLVKHLAAVDARQPQIGQQHVECEFTEAFERRFACGRLLHAIAVLTQAFRDDLTEGVLIVDEQEMLGRSVRHCF